MQFKAASVVLVLAVALVLFGAVGKAVVEDPILYNVATQVSSCAETKRYFIYNDKELTFFEAWHQCRSYGLRLAMVNSVVDDAKLKLAFAEKDFSQKEVYWIAATNIGRNGSYVWITDNTPVIYTNFLPQQPDNYGGDEHCIEVGHGGIGTTQWNDRQCEKKSRYICELKNGGC
ncbi:perlucin-like [Culex pipiens pallens]|uniref:perlucin-like n=1 Tax=Culex pipiens pallens TaxID=42434 RepID=UPI0022AAD578|nr:perlucin-like [Culex pipiens pallens]